MWMCPTKKIFKKNYKKLIQHNKTNYFLQYIRNVLFILIFILYINTEIWMDWQNYFNNTR